MRASLPTFQNLIVTARIIIVMVCFFTVFFVSKGRGYCNEVEEQEAVRVEMEQARAVSDLPGSLIEIGLQHIYDGEPDKSIQIFEKAIESFPNYPLPYLGLCRAHYEKGEYRESIHFFRRFWKYDFGALTLKPADKKLLGFYPSSSYAAETQECD